MADDHAYALLDMTVSIVANYVANNPIRPTELSSLILATHAALSGTGKASVEIADRAAKPSSSQIKRSISNAGIVSFIDGRTYQSLKRHLGTNGFTPQTYRETFRLRPDYPMVSPAYAARRSALAKAFGLGQGGRKQKPAAKPGAKSKKTRVAKGA